MKRRKLINFTRGSINAKPWNFKNKSQIEAEVQPNTRTFTKLSA